MSLGDHLRELRKRIIISVIGVLVAAIIGFIVTTPVIELLIQPIALVAEARGEGAAKLTFDVITGPFDLRLRIAISIGILLSAPVWLSQIWLFVSPGLTRKEVRYTVGFACAAIPLFFAGCATGLFIAPHMIELLLGFAPDDALVATYLTASYYYDFIFKLLLVIGIAYVVPVFLVLLNFAGILSGRAILKGWRIAVVGSATFAALATPSADVVSMLLLAAILSTLYLASAGLSVLFDKRRELRTARALEEGASL